MALDYIYSCTACNKSFEVTEKLAGMDHNCPFCEKSNSLPTLRAMRQLPRKSEQAAASKRAKGGETKSWLFSGGLLVGVVTGLLGLALYSYGSSLATESTVSQEIEYGRAYFDRLSAGQLWEHWDGMTKNGLPDWAETPQTRYNKQSAHLKNIAYLLYAVSAAGWLALIGSFFVSRK